VADGRHLGRLPHPSRKVFLDVLEDVVGAGVAVDDVASVLFLARPESFLPLCRPIRAFLTSHDGLGIDEADLPLSACDYLELLMFLTSEMEEGNLPYRDLAEMARAVAEGRTLAQGLAAEDRRRLVDIHLRPVLRRLFPRDPGAWRRSWHGFFEIDQYRVTPCHQPSGQLTHAPTLQSDRLAIPVSLHASGGIRSARMRD